MNGLILIVEDDKNMIALLELEISRKFGGAKTATSSFKDAPDRVKSLLPDLIILDLYDREVIDEPAAKGTWQVIWTDHFCPVVIHSAKEEAEYRDKVHPYVRYEIKGETSIGKVLEHITNFTPQIAKFRSMRAEFVKRAGEALRATSTLLGKQEKLSAQQEEIIVRSARRRVAASFDDVDKHEYGWERYVFPPLSSDLLMADVLQEVGRSATDPRSFRIVLTPSCDLATGEHRKPVENVLLAACSPFQDFRKAANLGETEGEKLRKRLRPELNRDQVGGYAPLPGLGELYPTMCVDFKNLSLVPLTDIGNTEDGKKFVRVASMDSPFREKIMWGYVQVGGRPATPDFDPKNWIEEIIATVAARDESRRGDLTHAVRGGFFLWSRRAYARVSRRGNPGRGRIGCEHPLPALLRGEQSASKVRVLRSEECDRQGYSQIRC